MEKKNTRLEEWLAEQMQDPEFVAAWQEIEPGYQVARLRIGKGTTQAELAARLGVTRQTIISIEKGKYDPSLELAFRIAGLFQATIEDIFSMERENKANLL